MNSEHKSSQTPSQTIGPFFAYGLTPSQYGYPFTDIANCTVVTPDIDGERIRIEGCVLDGNDAVVSDAMIEIWQADASGHYAQPNDSTRKNTEFTGFGRTGTGTDPESKFVFDTIKPGVLDDKQAPHINVVVFMRGLLTHVYTRMYFDDEAAQNDKDPVLNSVPTSRRHTLVARRETTQTGTVYRFNVHMQGENETAFFDV